MNYIVRGLSSLGEEVFYTGKAGKDFVSIQLCDAFTYSSIHGARLRATMLNNGHLIHGYWFIVLKSDMTPAY